MLQLQCVNATAGVTLFWDSNATCAGAPNGSLPVHFTPCVPSGGGAAPYYSYSVLCTSGPAMPMPPSSGGAGYALTSNYLGDASCGGTGAGTGTGPVAQSWVLTDTCMVVNASTVGPNSGVASVQYACGDDMLVSMTFSDDSCVNMTGSYLAQAIIAWLY